MLTDLQIKKLTVPERRREVPDGKVRGLYLVIQPSGARSWALRYRVRGVPRKFTLGVYPDLDLGAARKRAEEERGKLARNMDPAAEKKAAREARKAERSTADRVENVVDAFVRKHLAKKAKPSWAKEAERLLRVEIVPTFGKKRLSELTDVDVHKQLVEIADRAPVTARRAFAVFRKLCNWAMSLDGGKLIAASPCAGVTAPGEEHERDRVLGDDEIGLAWQAFEAIGWPFGSIGKLLILTGARRDEVGSMRWNEINLEAQTWTIPKERLKNGRRKNARPHEIPLSSQAIAIVSTLPRIGEDKAGLVFTTTGKTRVSGFSRAKAAIDRAILELSRAEAEARGNDPAAVEPLPAWVLHDLRRTVATNLQKLGVKLEVTEAVLNHVSGSRAGIVGVYQRHEYRAEKRQALDAWARRLDAIVSGAAAGNVVDFAKARG